MNKLGVVVKTVFLISIILFGFYNCALLASEVPKSEKEIPIYPGAKINTTKTSEQNSQTDWDMNKNLRSAVMKVYNSDASIEDIVNFYLQKIGGEEGTANLDPKGLKPGTVSKVWYEIEYYTDEDFKDYTIEYDVKHYGTWMKQKLAENRKPLKPGKWIKEAKFNWYKKESNNDGTTFYLIISDQSFDFADGKKYKTSTEIEVQVTTEKSEQAMQEESDEQMDRAVEAETKSLKSKPPTAKELGVPIYPGSTFNADASAGMSAGNDYAMYIYLTTDEPSKVVSFYEKQLSKKAAETVKGRYLIPLKGKMPIPEEGISIEPNIMFGGKAKTVITIQKKFRD